MEASIIGYYGCYCHPFKSWDECKKYQQQKLKIGDEVTHRCNKKAGVVCKVDESCFVNVRYGPLQRDIHLENVEQLIKSTHN